MATTTPITYFIDVKNGGTYTSLPTDLFNLFGYNNNPNYTVVTKDDFQKKSGQYDPSGNVYSTIVDPNTGLMTSSDPNTDLPTGNVYSTIVDPNTGLMTSSDPNTDLPTGNVYSTIVDPNTGLSNIYYQDSQGNQFAYTPEEIQQLKSNLVDSNGNVSYKNGAGQIMTMKFEDFISQGIDANGMGSKNSTFLDKNGTEITGDKAWTVPQSRTTEMDYIKNNTRPDGTILVTDANGQQTVTTPETYLANKNSSGWSLPALNKGTDADIKGLTIDEIIQKYPDRFPDLKISSDWQKDQDTISGYDTQIKGLQREINSINADVEAAKNNNPFYNDGGANDIKLKQLQNSIDVLNTQKQAVVDSETQRGISKYYTGSEASPTYIPEEAIGTYIQDNYSDFLPQGDSGNNSGYGAGNPNSNNSDFGSLTSDEWMAKIYNQLIPTYSEQVKNDYGPALMDAYSKSLESQYGKDYKTTLENAASRGMSTSGTTGQQLADLLSNKNLNIQNKENQIGDNLQTYLDSLTKNGYNTAVQNYSQELMDKFEKSGQSWNDFYNANQTDINNQLNEKAAQTGVDFTQYQNDQDASNKDYQDQLNAISNLFQSGGSAAGTATYNYTNQSSTPVTAAVMPYYSTNTNTTGGVSNNTTNDLSKTLNTNPSTGKTYDLYSGNNYLGY